MNGPVYFSEGITIYNADCTKVLPDLEAEYDLVFADPPYGLGINYGVHDDSELIDPDTWLPDCRRLGPTIVTPGVRNLYRYPEPDYLGIRYDRTAQSGSGIAYLSKWEPILFYGKFTGRLPWDVIETANQAERSTEGIDHPVPKPKSLLRALFTAFLTPGDRVLDPFLGSGTTAKVAREFGVECTGIEIDPHYVQTILDRLSQMVIPFQEPLFVPATLEDPE